MPVVFRFKHLARNDYQARHLFANKLGLNYHGRDLVMAVMISIKNKGTYVFCGELDKLYKEDVDGGMVEVLDHAEKRDFLVRVDCLPDNCRLGLDIPTTTIQQTHIVCEAAVKV